MSSECSEFPVGRDTWLAIEPLIFQAVECLSRRFESLVKGEANRSALVKQVEEYLAGQGRNDGAGEAVAVECSREAERELHGEADKATLVEVEDIAWQSDCYELVCTLRRYGLDNAADEIEKRRTKRRTFRSAMAVDELTHRREYDEAEVDAICWLLRYLQEIQGKQATPAGEQQATRAQSGKETPDVQDTEDPELPVGDDKKVKAKTPLKRPPKKAFQAWYTRDVLGISNQTEIAKKMTEMGIRATQGQVSKWVTAVDQYRQAGGLMPQHDNLDSIDTVDPSVIDMGARQDGRTPRQRHRQDNESD